MRPLLCPAKRRAAPMNEGGGGKTRAREALSSICSLSPSLLSPSPVLSPSLAAVTITALLRALRWEAHTEGSLQPKWSRWKAAERTDSSYREQERGAGWPLLSLPSLKTLYPGWGIQQGWYLLPLVSCNCEVFNRLLLTPDMDPGWRWIVLVLTVRGIGCGLEYWCGAPELWDVNLLGHVWFLQDAKAVWVSAHLEFYTWNSHVCFHVAAGYHTNSLFSDFVKEVLLDKSMSPFLFKFAPKKINLAFNLLFVKKKTFWTFTVKYSLVSRLKRRGHN